MNAKCKAIEDIERAVDLLDATSMLLLDLTRRVEKLEAQMRRHQHRTITRSGGHVSERPVMLP